MNRIPNFKIRSTEVISDKFLELGVHDFQTSLLFIKNLPYKRNSNKLNSLCVFADSGGTCSTKHALLKNLATENIFNDLQLMLGIFMINEKNTPKLSHILLKYQIKEMPEAHNYLKYRNEIIDCTRKNSSAADFVDDLVEEVEIQPLQITDFKIQYHQKFLRTYLQENPNIPYSTDQFWQIREECILALQQ